MEYFTPIDNLLRHTKSHPDEVLMNQPVNREWHQFTWRNVEHQARCIASGLKAQHYEKGSKIGILSKNCAEWIIADLAIMMAGMVSVPIYATANTRTISYVIEHSDIKAVFIGKLDDTNPAEEAIPKNVLRIAFPYPTVNARVNFSDWLIDFKPLSVINMPLINDMATIVYTSGSTGDPKGVVLTYKNLASAAQHSSIAIKFKDSDRVLSYLPLAHVTERSFEFVSLYVGFELFFSESFDTFIDDLKYAKPTAFYSVPRLWSIFQSRVLTKIPQNKLNILLAIPVVGRFVAYKIRSELGLQHVTIFGSGSAPIAKSLLKWYQKLRMPICEGWGMTETSGMSCGNFPWSEKNIGTIGVPIDCVEMKLSAEKEILIRGDAVFSDYYLNPEATAASFTHGWFHTGDIGEINDEGVYNIIGRIKEQFKTGKGKYVAPVPIESALSASLDIEQVCVIGIGLKQPIALVVLAGLLNRKDVAVENRLKCFLKTVNDELEVHQKVDYLFLCKSEWTIENNCLTPTMKIKRNVLEQKYGNLIPNSPDAKVVWEEE
ncbi:AMP-binding protein [Colwellia sp. 12G3]|uniref:AMP-binding protein n=1 Tax=Colwellia sp. 12G3 TaxID=2058299 RepID=UPI000C33E739|nr:AMP-binding protein [Colwellia sp. 12G3]PKI12622.1 AMP-dependent synthetase [Colwellia sp. 12G3]